ncbi:ABC transporter permease [Rathayibacter sp. Leaf296]|uniref:ABC transporter permease n=1 Tax=Rathayibacter sp. Leaf296 TaxID=1736327 RepID=UPI000703B0C3|nr:ABC transporter permease [Rathayibacter sp. Leaf296]KQQ08490.1 ABC transporter permease [Rathayibacter sp. Leaf296]
MLSVILKRVLISIPLLLITSLITFLLLALLPGDPARAIVGVQGTPEDYERVREQLHLNEPLWQQFSSYVGGLLRGDLGSSLYTGESVSQMLGSRLPVTLSIIIGATLVGAVVGIVLGVLSARYGGALGRTVDVVSLMGLALPNFWLALLLVTLFAVTVPLFPATGYVPLDVSPDLWLASITLPVIALAVGSVASISKITRDGVADALEQDYIRTLRSAGVSETSLLWKHALKNAGVPVVTVVGLSFLGALAGSLFVEAVFVLPGLGALVNDATTRQDIPVIQGIALAYAVIVVIVNLLVDISYAYLNPKVRTA